jgi:hypothetical protein
MLPSVQIIARLCYNGTLVLSYGFENDLNQREFIKVWQSAKNDIYELGESRERSNKVAAKQIIEGM